MKIELRKSKEANYTSEILIDGEMVGCDASDYYGCDKLYNELIRDTTGEKALIIKSITCHHQ